MNVEKSKKQETCLAISRTKSFRRFQSQVGSATYRLNTIFVGLEHIAAGKGKKSDGLAVTWTEPATEEIARQVADQARSFACLAATALIFDVADRYLVNLAAEDWLGISPATQAILSRSVQRSAADGGAYGLHERANILAKEFGIDEAVHTALLEMLAKWRNASVHGTDRKMTLTDKSLEALTDVEGISKEYSHLNITLALRNLVAHKVPVPKEITSLIASAQNFFRKIDNALIVKAAGNSESVRRLFFGFLYRHFLSTGNRGSTNRAALSEFSRGTLEWRRGYLLKVLAPSGLTMTTKPISASIPESLVEELVHLDAEQFLKRVERDSA